MKTHIYIIKNNINDKVYIGQTKLSLSERFKKHIYDSKTPCKKHRPLFLAFEKYGIENFYIELIEDCDSEFADEREIYWIKYFNSYNENGYNATIGGTMYEPYDYKYIANLIKLGLTTKEIVQKIGCCKQLVYRVAKLNNLKINGANHNKQVAQYTKNDNLLQIFNSLNEAARYIKTSNNISSNISTIRTNISRKCRNNKYKIAYNYKWNYI